MNWRAATKIACVALLCIPTDLDRNNRIEKAQVLSMSNIRLCAIIALSSCNSEAEIPQIANKQEGGFLIMSDQNYGIVRIGKAKSGDILKLQKHINREKESYQNPDIDRSRSNLNYSLIHCTDFKKEVSHEIEELHLKRAVRKDANVMLSGIMTASPEFFQNECSELMHQQEFFKSGDGTSFLQKFIWMRQPLICTSAVSQSRKTDGFLQKKLLGIRQTFLDSRTECTKNALSSMDYYEE